jgi:hypothetical protein
MENLGEDLKEVVNEGGGIKKVIIGIISTITISAMGLVGKIINDKFLGGDSDNTEVAAPSQQQNVNISGPEIIINIPEQKQSETKVVERVVEKPVVVPPKKTETEKRKEEGLDW